ncbi:peptidyl-prolyl cis-trans isomerase FKBP4-like [Centruroides sculpturatus]|uniref:peptidyl-prolyl cis-trans isomerase FKBP4-like n=1 Tax=Centruroides sculpturatus TaxID=218467 RepID=UPI000C6D4144|nr:peptidyl-prolyl cis-trans isomerase FKBP4-like [Centruroides sculpturatus]
METESETPVQVEMKEDEGIDITPSQDGGVLKKIIREGTGEESPSTGEKVFAHYVGKLLDGTVFDSSKERGLFEFTLGKGSVIKAWDIGIATMKKGEIALLTCKPEYAYGKAGSPPKIPPDATLIFEIELHDWNWEDLSSSQDGGIQRKIIEKGEGYATPNDGASVEVHLIGKCNDKVFEDREVNFIIGEGSESNILESIEHALQKFKKGEKSLIKLKPKYAYGDEGRPDLNIPSNSDVQYEIHLKSFEKTKGSWEMDSDEKLEQSEISKNKGTNYFKAGKYNLAVKQYKKIIDFLEYETSLSDDDTKKRNILMLAGYLNLAMCNLKLNNYLEAIKYCDKAIELDSENEKGYFRRGMAYFSQNEFELAKKDFQKVLSIDPKNKAAHNQILNCNNKIKAQLDKERKTYRNMFEKFAKQDLEEMKKNQDGSLKTGVWMGAENEKNDVTMVGDSLEAGPVPGEEGSMNTEIDRAPA